MNANIKNNQQQNCHDMARFLDIIFKDALLNSQGEIELRAFPLSGNTIQEFFINTYDVACRAYSINSGGTDIYFGINPRVGKKGKKNNIKYITVLHSEIDYGSDGHEKKSEYQTYHDALNAINQFPYQPTIIIHSGGGFHCYWVLNHPEDVSRIGIENIEQVNKELCRQLGGDQGTHDITRLLRIPWTHNHKLPDNPRPVTVINDSGPKYDFDYLADQLIPPAAINDIGLENDIIYPEDNVFEYTSVQTLPISDKMKKLILEGNDGRYKSRSEADMAVITALLHVGLNKDAIAKIFSDNEIGQKYREQKKPKKYLDATIKAAKKYSHLTEEELLNPLFTSGAINKEKDKYSLDVYKLQVSLCARHHVKCIKDETLMYKFNGKYYEIYNKDEINLLCQRELGKYRRLFLRKSVEDFIHYAKGDSDIYFDPGNKKHNYITLQNGLFEVENRRLIPHTPDIFTTYLLPFKYDRDAECPRFLQYLDEVFLKDNEKIDFAQEAVGYGFHFGLPTAALFLLVGSGNNGKSVFINTLTSLFGEENSANINIGQLSQEYYLMDLMGKMINVSTESPGNRMIDTEILKAATSGDLITARNPHERPVKFRPIAKHYLAMNELPIIDDKSYGLDRRIFIVEFPRKFKDHETDTSLTEKLQAELSGIFNWALAGYIRLKGKDFKFDVAESLKRRKQEILYESDSVKVFIDEKIIRTDNEDDQVKYGDAYNLYKEFCREIDTDPVKKSDFRSMVQNLDFKIKESTKMNNHLVIFEAKINQNSEED